MADGMLRLKNILAALNDINEAANKVLKKSLVHTNLIPNDYADEVVYRYPNLKREDVIDQMMNVTHTAVLNIRKQQKPIISRETRINTFIVCIHTCVMMILLEKHKSIFRI